MDCPNCRLYPTPLSGGPFRSASGPQPLSPPLNCDLGLCPRETRRSQRNGRALSSPSPASAAPSPVSSAPPSRAPVLPASSLLLSAALTGAPSELSAASRPPTQGPVSLFSAALRAEQSSHRPAPRLLGQTAGLLVSSASPSAAAVFLRYVGAAGLPQSRQRLPRWPQDCAGPGPCPRPLAQPAWRLCGPHGPPGRSCHRACAGLPWRCAPGSLPHAPMLPSGLSVHLRLSRVPPAWVLC